MSVESPKKENRPEVGGKVFKNENNIADQIETRPPNMVKKMLARIRDAYRGVVNSPSVSAGKNIKEKLKSELKEAAREAIRDGVDFLVARRMSS